MKNAETLAVASKETGLEVNAEETKYMVMSQDQNAARSHNIKNDYSSTERVEELKYLGTTLTYQNSIQEIKSILTSGNACYRLVQKLWSSTGLSKNTKIKIQRTIILPVVLQGCETWLFTMREEHRLTVAENRLPRTYGPKRDEVTVEWRTLYEYKRELHDLYSS